MMGIGLSFFTEGVGAGPRKHMDILGLGMADGAELRIHPTGKAVPDRTVRDVAGSGPRDAVRPDRRPRSSGSRPRTSRCSRATPTTRPSGSVPTARARRPSPAAAAIVARRVKDKARIIAAAALECSPDDLEWEHGRWFVKGDPEKGQTIQEIAFASHGNLELPEEVEGHLDAASSTTLPTSPSPSGRTSASSTSTRGPARSRSAASSPWMTVAPASTR